MLSLISPNHAQHKLAQNTRARRLQMQLTQAGLAKRAGVALPTLRKFEQQGRISLESFLKLYLVLGGLEKLIKATALEPAAFASLDELLNSQPAKARQRGKLG